MKNFSNNRSNKKKEISQNISIKLQKKIKITQTQNYHQNQVHFLCTIDGPDSSYSSFLIHISSNVLNEDKMEPPIHTEYFLSGGAIILIVIESGAKALTSCCTRSGICH